MYSFFVKIPKWAQRLQKKQVWSIPTSKKEIYLTFDDGPTPEITEWVLNELNKYDAKATFFCIGKNILQHPTILEKILSENHRIGNHTQNHIKGWGTDNTIYLNDILKAETVLNKHNIKSTRKLFRPPYGKINNSQLKKVISNGYSVIMWDVLSADFDMSISGEQCLNNVLVNAKKGSIIVFHDSKKASKNLKYALPKVLEHFKKEGYIFNPIT